MFNAEGRCPNHCRHRSEVAFPRAAVLGDMPMPSPSDTELRARLACPSCHGALIDLTQGDRLSGLACAHCKVRFDRAESGVWNFLLEDARPWTPAAQVGKR